MHQPPERILKVYTEALTGFSPIYHPEGLNLVLLSQGCVLEANFYSGNPVASVGKIEVDILQTGVRMEVGKTES